MSFESGFINGTMIGASLGNSVKESSMENPKSVSRRLLDILNSDIEFDEKMREKRKIEKEEIRNNRYSNLSKILCDNNINGEIRDAYLYLAKYMDSYGLYLYDVNVPYLTYENIQRKYQIQFYEYQGEYRCVAWGGDILKEDKIGELKSKKEELKLEKEKLNKQYKDNAKIYCELEYGEFKNVDFNSYSKNIRNEILKLMVSELEYYIKDRTKETMYDIKSCENEIDECIYEIDKILKHNQKNIEKTISYKIKKLFNI